MMGETLWRRCPNATYGVHPEYPPEGNAWYCPCHKGWGNYSLVPVAEGAVLIEDREQAIERMQAEFWCSGADMARLLAAAEGREG